MIPRVTFGAALAATLIGCGGGGRTSQSTVRDSAGVTIVENVAGSWSDETAWRLSDEPVLDIGVLEGDPHDQLFQVSGATRLRDGRIVIANSGTDELRFFDAAGSYLMSAAREGDGPGEFQGLLWARALAGDSLIAFDRALFRISVFGPDARFVRSFQVTSPGERQPVQAVGVFPDGDILVMALNLFSSDMADGYQRRKDSYDVYSRAGERVSHVGDFLGNEMFIRTGSGTRGRFVSFMSIPFGRTSAVVVRGQDIVYGDANDYEIRVYGRDGTLLRLIRRRFSPRQVTDADFDAFLDQMVERLQGGVSRADLEHTWSEVPRPEFMPAYDELASDPLGHVWVRNFAVGASVPHTWTVFDPDGRMLGDVVTPPRFEISEIGDLYVLGTWTDEMEVEHVRMYRLKKGSA